MFRLGRYYDHEARDIAEYLRDAGMKVEIKTFTVGELDVFDYLESKASEIKGELDEESFNKYALWLNALRKVLSEGATADNFIEKFQMEIDPQIDEKRNLFSKVMEGSISEEELEAKMSNSSELFRDLNNMSNAEMFVDTVLDRNNIEIGEMVMGRLDDPLLRIFTDEARCEEGEDEDHKSTLAKTTTTFDLRPCSEVYIDEFSCLFAEEIDDEFEEEYPDEYTCLVLLGKLISELTEPSAGKIDMEAFADRCDLQMENNGDLLEINGRSAAGEIARSLEKNDVIKVKGDNIKWRR